MAAHGVQELYEGARIQFSPCADHTTAWTPAPRVRPVNKFHYLLSNLPLSDYITVHGTVDRTGFLALPKPAESR